MFATTSPDFRLFWTAYDPLDLASGGIDPLGLERGYIALADKLLPTFTTVTSVPRYVSMLCGAIAAAEAAFPGFGETPSSLRARRLQAVLSYERAWAFACGLAEHNPDIGDAATQGLRGVRYVRRRIAEMSGSEKTIRTRSFNLLSHQTRNGGIGAYSTMLDDCRLASMKSLALRPLGQALAEAFPKPPGDPPLWDEDRPLDVEELATWGIDCHLSTFTPDEGSALAAAISGDDEAGWDDDVRWTAVQLVAACSRDDEPEAKLLDRMLEVIRSGGLDSIHTPGACSRQIEAAIVLIRPYEILSQSVQYLFDVLRAVATDKQHVRFSEAGRRPDVVSACRAAQDSADDLFRALTAAEAAHAPTANELREKLAQTGVLSLADTLRVVSDHAVVLKHILDRHTAVQQGRFDRGERKAAWLRCDAGDDVARLTAQRHQLPPVNRRDSWFQMPTRSYRTFAAKRFASACGLV